MGGAAQALSERDCAFLRELEGMHGPHGAAGHAPAQGPAHGAPQAPPQNAAPPGHAGRGGGRGQPLRGRGIPIGGVNGCPREGEKGNWRCTECSNINFGHRDNCNRCRASRMTAASLPIPQDGFRR